MSQDRSTFLTLVQAVDALAQDFKQYGPQPRILHKIGPLILGRNFTTAMFNGRKRAWVRPMDSAPFAPVDETALGFYLIHMLETGDIHAKAMARICSLVFEAPVSPGSLRGEPGVWVKSQMAGFLCRRCGNCCRRLGHACTGEDARLWRRLGRDDILVWVKPEPLDGGKIRYRIWVNSQTGEPAEFCPFLVRQPGTGRFSCTIQEVKPLVCREYPFTRKHARYTGCPGFDTVKGTTPLNSSSE